MSFGGWAPPDPMGDLKRFPDLLAVARERVEKKDWKRKGRGQEGEREARKERYKREREAANVGSGPLRSS